MIKEHAVSNAVGDDEVAQRVAEPFARMAVQEKAGQLSDVLVFDNTTARSQPEASVAAVKVGAILFVSDPVEINRP
ncbi:hypothetical protein [Sphingomonas melonis]|uniref:Uncharacterized protein n=1 Tax=Sphingomonas melonis TaxID=152682 RepID=A0A7Y9FKS0_9SPHN|nr:hypothetical protein [Sphingomonas melonis]NYD89140.1 hypothetical protein [Sphingomonas melonis]